MAYFLILTLSCGVSIVVLTGEKLVGTEQPVVSLNHPELLVASPSRKMVACVNCRFELVLIELNRRVSEGWFDFLQGCLQRRPGPCVSVEFYHRVPTSSSLPNMMEVCFFLSLSFSYFVGHVLPFFSWVASRTSVLMWLILPRKWMVYLTSLFRWMVTGCLT